MFGGLGDDIYIVAQTMDTANESAGEGTDLVRSSVAFTLGTNVENLTLTGTGSGVNGIGNALDNILIGNGVSNTLTGNGGNDPLDGGAGVDTMNGGAGNDVYFSDVADIINNSLLNGGANADTVTSTANNDLLIGLMSLSVRRPQSSAMPASARLHRGCSRSHRCRTRRRDSIDINAMPRETRDLPPLIFVIGVARVPDVYDIKPVI